MKILFLVLALFVLVFIVLAWFTGRTARRIEAFLPARGWFVDVPGARLHIREAGVGPAILLVHGLGGQSAHFDYGVFETLARNHRVIAVDRPGSGWSERVPGTPADLSTQAAALAALIGSLGLERPTVAGHSLGGAVALTLALEHPDKVGALALIAPLTHVQSAPPEVFRALAIGSPWLRTLFAWTLATPGAIAGGKKVLATVFAPESVPRDFPVKGGGMLSLRPRQFLAASSDMQALPAHMPRLVDRYGQLAVPTGVLYGRGDAILAWEEHGQALADKVPGLRLELVEGGHMLPVTQPQAVADFVSRCAQFAAPERAAG
ncbi:alpha/beta fold hydrolase [Massilia sp. Leaf139]|uniref:alpha/beta fold hydrolase n=1 Tax=Massilia sp. Leaf139 TaxID=1736272 RepID=UPI0006F7083E|nr:alpha/beta fold hydrolase [Massilia sp. Leaf139]KQQ97312.1 alpha/beta hydrolase [Massilia sp. Leaf139]